MSEERQLLLSTASTIFKRIATHEQFTETELGRCNVENWSLIEESGLDQALLPDGFCVADALAIVRSSGWFALPVPLVETMVAKRILTEAGVDIPDGIISVASDCNLLSVKHDNNVWQVSGTLSRVPWGRFATYVLTATSDTLLLIPTATVSIENGANLAGEPRDTMRINQVMPAWGVKELVEPLAWPLPLAAAALRSIQIAGALERVLEMTTEYANERSQFGRSIGKFQVIQQYLALLAGHTAAAGAAADIAVDALASNARELPIAVAIAKARTSEAVGPATALAHQVHGAMGITHEYPLQFLTRRLWSWRDEYGGEAVWNKQIGKAFTAGGADEFWPQVVSIR